MRHLMEASLLGLKVGEWPSFVWFAGHEYARVRCVKNAAGDLQSYLYFETHQQPDAAAVLEVLND